MAKDKFAALSEVKKEITEAATMKDNNSAAPGEKETVNFKMSVFPKDLHDAIKASGEPVNSFIKRAARKVAREEGLI